MTAQPRAQLYTYFETGDLPTQAQFQNLIDSALNLADTSAQVIASDVSALRKLDVNGNFTVVGSALSSLTGNTSVGGTLSVTNTASVAGLSVTGSAAASFSGNATVTGGLVAGSPTGGNKGAGTLNATAVYSNGNLLGSGINPVAGASMNVSAVVTTAGNSATFTADQIVVATALAGTYQVLSSFSQALNLGTTGAGGMDTGSAPISGFVSVYAIAKADGTKNILACASTTSTATIYAGANLPSGYTYSALIGTWPTNGSRQFITGIQKGRHFVFTQMTALSGGLQTAITSVSLTSIVPPNAIALDIILNTAYNGTTGFSSYYSDSVGDGQIATARVNSTVTSTLVSVINSPMGVSQTLYYSSSDGTTGVSISIIGYWF